MSKLQQLRHWFDIQKITSILNRLETWIKDHKYLSFFSGIAFIAFAMIFTVVQVISLREMGSIFALFYFIFCLMYTVFIIYFMSGLDRTVEKAVVDSKVSIGVSFFLLSVGLYILLIVFYAPLYIGRVVEGNSNSVSMFTCLYFSVMTVTTVGFGDVVPQHGLGKVFVTFEAISGFLYWCCLQICLAKSLFTKIKLQRHFHKHI